MADEDKEDDDFEVRPTRGRPSKYMPEFATIAEKLCKHGAATEAEVAEIFGVSINTIRSWKIKHPEFLAACKISDKEANERVKVSLYHRAIGYSFDAVKIIPPTGKRRKPMLVRYTEHVPPDTNAAKFWLLNRERELWAERHEVTGKDGSPLMGDKSLEQIRQEILQEIQALGLASELEGQLPQGVLGKRNGATEH